ncbi:MAG: RNA polymerase sigma factor [Ignavibacteria bacterium]|nr:MAG: RNA polymerase sigma factor [Ignavibacteria bacterium]
MKKYNYIIQKKLIKQCLEGDKASFKTLIKPFLPKLLNYLFKLSGSRENAEDLMQETLIKIWLGLQNYNHVNSFDSWVFSIAHNTAIDYLRKNKYVQYPLEIDVSGNSDPHNEIVKKELDRNIVNALLKLSGKQQDTFILRVYGGLKFKEIAEILNEPLNTVLSHMNYAVKKIKKIMSEENAA